MPQIQFSLRSLMVVMTLICVTSAMARSGDPHAFLGVAYLVLATALPLLVGVGGKRGWACLIFLLAGLGQLLRFAFQE